MYRGVVQNAIKSIKYRFQYDVAASLVVLIPHKKLPFPPSAVIYPIPLHKERLRWRGFNQAQKLGVFIARKFQHPMADGLLIRIQHRTPQADIRSREERVKNAHGLFALKSHTLPESVILFDDVWTTGSTMKEAAKVLKHGGVKQVFGLTIAR
jgi:ComF family protein